MKKDRNTDLVIDELADRAGVGPEVRAVTAVSYTHLDVYKRQPVEGAYRRCDFIRKKLFNIHRMSNLGANLRFLSE